MSTDNVLTEYALRCPKCGYDLYVRHSEGGTLDREQGKHYVTNIHWTAECHNAECKWESPKRSTEWALIRTVVSENGPTPGIVSG